MKYNEIQELSEAGLISTEQRDRIINHYGLKQGNPLLAILSFLGSILVATGLILVISSNWEEIPRLAKIVSGILIMTGLHAGALALKARKAPFYKTAEALHLAG